MKPPEPRICPLCHSPLIKHLGAIEEDVIRTGPGRIWRRVRPAVFWACSICEHCEEQ